MVWFRQKCEVKAWTKQKKNKQTKEVFLKKIVLSSGLLLHIIYWSIIQTRRFFWNESASVPASSWLCEFWVVWIFSSFFFFLLIWWIVQIMPCVSPLVVLRMLCVSGSAGSWESPLERKGKGNNDGISIIKFHSYHHLFIFYICCLKKLYIVWLK